MDMKTSPLATLADADGKATIAVHNPADGQQIGAVPNMGAAETRRAIEAANAAWPAWRAKTAKERAAILMKWFHLLHQHVFFNGG